MSYTKYVIIGQERTGSTFLQMLLDSNKRILSFGELFNPTDEIRKSASKKIERIITLKDNPIEYLEDYVYKDYSNTIKAVGFRLFYTHARKRAWRAIWEYLKHSKVKVIHVKRRNLLDRYLSLRLALRSEEWIAFKRTPPSDTEPITLNLKACLKDFRRIIQIQEEMDDFFKESPKIEIIYEDLIARQVEECERLQNFLGVGSQELSTNMVKQQTRKKSEVITNYDELKQQFTIGVSKGWAKEEWLDFFEEEQSVARRRSVNIQNNKTNCSRFIILSDGRTGSSLLVTLLASHGEIIAYGEIFNPNKKTRKKAVKLSPPLASSEAAIKYLETHIYTEYPASIKGVGFKLHYTHAKNNDQWQEAWEYLRQSQVKVIHLKRRNLLNRYLSLELARRSNVWVKVNDQDNGVNEPIILNLKDCFKDFQATLRHQKRMDDFFQDNPKIEVIYEELVGNMVEESKRIQDFLGVEYQPLSTMLKKQRTQKKSEVIANYDELKQQFTIGVSKGWAKEEWLDFFEEE